MKKVRLALAAVVLASVSGCGGAPDLGPPQIRLNQDTCHECGMMLSEEKHAAAVMVLRDGLEEKYLFDDTGELLEFEVPAGATEVRRYVHDYPSGRWIDAATAHFVKAKEFRTPMGTGVVAFEDRAAAAAAATERQGELLAIGG